MAASGKSKKSDVVDSPIFKNTDPRWCSKEESILLDAIDAFGYGNWDLIADLFAFECADKNFTVQDIIDHCNLIFGRDALGAVWDSQYILERRTFLVDHTGPEDVAFIDSSDLNAAKNLTQSQLDTIGYMPLREDFQSIENHEIAELIPEIHFKDNYINQRLIHSSSEASSAEEEHLREQYAEEDDWNSVCEEAFESEGMGSISDDSCGQITMDEISDKDSPHETPEKYEEDKAILKGVRSKRESSAKTVDHEKVYEKDSKDDEDLKDMTLRNRKQLTYQKPAKIEMKKASQEQLDMVDIVEKAGKGKSRGRKGAVKRSKVAPKVKKPRISRKRKREDSFEVVKEKFAKSNDGLAVSKTVFKAKYDSFEDESDLDGKEFLEESKQDGESNDGEKIEGMKDEDSNEWITDEEDEEEKWKLEDELSMDENVLITDILLAAVDMFCRDLRNKALAMKLISSHRLAEYYFTHGETLMKQKHLHNSKEKRSVNRRDPDWIYGVLKTFARFLKSEELDEKMKDFLEEIKLKEQIDDLRTQLDNSNYAAFHFSSKDSDKDNKDGTESSSDSEGCPESTADSNNPGNSGTSNQRGKGNSKYNAGKKSFQSSRSRRKNKKDKTKKSDANLKGCDTPESALCESDSIFNSHRSVILKQSPVEVNSEPMDMKQENMATDAYSKKLVKESCDNKNQIPDSHSPLNEVSISDNSLKSASDSVSVNSPYNASKFISVNSSNSASESTKVKSSLGGNEPACRKLSKTASESISENSSNNTSESVSENSSNNTSKSEHLNLSETASESISRNSSNYMTKSVYVNLSKTASESIFVNSPYNTGKSIAINSSNSVSESINETLSIDRNKPVSRKSLNDVGESIYVNSSRDASKSTYLNLSNNVGKSISLNSSNNVKKSFNVNLKNNASVSVSGNSSNNMSKSVYVIPSKTARKSLSENSSSITSESMYVNLSNNASESISGKSPINVKKSVNQNFSNNTSETVSGNSSNTMSKSIYVSLSKTTSESMYVSLSNNGSESKSGKLPINVKESVNENLTNNASESVSGKSSNNMSKSIYVSLSKTASESVSENSSNNTSESMYINLSNNARLSISVNSPNNPSESICYVNISNNVSESTSVNTTAQASEKNPSGQNSSVLKDKEIFSKFSKGFSLPVTKDNELLNQNGSSKHHAAANGDTAVNSTTLPDCSVEPNPDILKISKPLKLLQSSVIAKEHSCDKNDCVKDSSELMERNSFDATNSSSLLSESLTEQKDERVVNKKRFCKGLEQKASNQTSNNLSDKDLPTAQWKFMKSPERLIPSVKKNDRIKGHENTIVFFDNIQDLEPSYFGLNSKDTLKKSYPKLSCVSQKSFTNGEIFEKGSAKEDNFAIVNKTKWRDKISSFSSCEEDIGDTIEDLDYGSEDTSKVIHISLDGIKLNSDDDPHSEETPELSSTKVSSNTPHSLPSPQLEVNDLTDDKCKKRKYEEIRSSSPDCSTHPEKRPKESCVVLLNKLLQSPEDEGDESESEGDKSCEDGYNGDDSTGMSEDEEGLRDKKVKPKLHSHKQESLIESDEEEHRQSDDEGSNKSIEKGVRKQESDEESSEGQDAKENSNDASKQDLNSENNPSDAESEKSTKCVCQHCCHQNASNEDSKAESDGEDRDVFSENDSDAEHDSKKQEECDGEEQESSDQEESDHSEEDASDEESGKKMKRSCDCPNCLIANKEEKEVESDLEERQVSSEDENEVEKRANNAEQESSEEDKKESSEEKSVKCVCPHCCSQNASEEEESEAESDEEQREVSENDSDAAHDSKKQESSDEDQEESDHSEEEGSELASGKQILSDGESEKSSKKSCNCSNCLTSNRADSNAESDQEERQVSSKEGSSSEQESNDEDKEESGDDAKSEKSTKCICKHCRCQDASEEESEAESDQEQREVSSEKDSDAEHDSKEQEECDGAEQEQESSEQEELNHSEEETSDEEKSEKKSCDCPNCLTANRAESNAESDLEEKQASSNNESDVEKKTNNSEQESSDVDKVESSDDDKEESSDDDKEESSDDDKGESSDDEKSTKCECQNCCPQNASEEESEAESDEEHREVSGNDSDAEHDLKKQESIGVDQEQESSDQNQEESDDSEEETSDVASEKQILSDTEPGNNSKESCESPDCLVAHTRDFQRTACIQGSSEDEKGSDCEKASESEIEPVNECHNQTNGCQKSIKDTRCLSEEEEVDDAEVEGVSKDQDFKEEGNDSLDQNLKVKLKNGLFSKQETESSESKYCEKVCNESEEFNKESIEISEKYNSDQIFLVKESNKYMSNEIHSLKYLCEKLILKTSSIQNVLSVSKKDTCEIMNALKNSHNKELDLIAEGKAELFCSLQSNNGLCNELVNYAKGESNTISLIQVTKKESLEINSGKNLISIDIEDISVFEGKLPSDKENGLESSEDEVYELVEEEEKIREGKIDLNEELSNDEPGSSKDEEPKTPKETVSLTGSLKSGESDEESVYELEEEEDEDDIGDN